MHNLTQRGNTQLQYASRTIHAAQGLHEAAFAILANNVPPPATVLDIGAGSGAFSQRLKDHGYNSLPIDLDTSDLPTEWVSHEVDVCKDLSQSFSHNSIPNAVALEVLEHLPSVPDFLRDLYRIIEPGGFVLLSTPNVKHPYSRLKFLTRGTFNLFSPTFYWSTGHISILPDWLLTEHLTNCGFVNIKLGLAGKISASSKLRPLIAAINHVPGVLQSQLGTTQDGAILLIACHKPVDLKGQG